MKFIQILSLAIMLISIPQSASCQMSDKKKLKFDASNLAFYQKVFLDKEGAFDVNKVDASLSKESYILLAKYSYISIGHNNYGKSRGVNRKRILLQDAKAVTDFSEFYFQKSETTVISINKKNGSEELVNLSNAVAVNTEIPKVYRERFQSENYFKLAIPNLEVGDIIDFTNIYSEEIGTIFSNSDIIGDDVPVLNHRIIIDVDDSWLVVRNTFNTQKRFTTTRNGGQDYEGKPSGNMNRFELNLGYQAAIQYEKWSDISKDFPLMKFLAISKKNEVYFFGEKNGIYDSISLPKLVLNFNKASLIDPSIDYFIRDFSVYEVKPKDVGVKVKPNDFADQLYYHLQYQFTKYRIPSEIVKNCKTNNYSFDDYFERMGDGSLPSFYFINMLTQVFNKYNYDADIVAYLPEGTKSSDVVLLSDIELGVYLPDLKKTYWAVDNFSNHMYVPYGVNNGAKGKGFSFKSLKENKAIPTNIVFPMQTVQDNRDVNNIVINLVADSSLVYVQKESEFFGLRKLSVTNLIEKFGNFIMDDWKNTTKYYSESDEKARLEFVNLTGKNSKVYKDYVEKSLKDQKENFENWLKNDDEVIKLLDYKLLSTGRTPKNPSIKLSARFSSQNQLKKLGKNLVFNIGSFIENQYKLEEKDKKERKNNIDFGYQRRHEYNIKLKIPTGYTIDNVEALNKKVEYPFCKFVSTATLTGGDLEIKTIKDYGAVNLTSKEWDSIKIFLETAYNFSQENIVLKKI
jgi:hypothetical protein